MERWRGGVKFNRFRLRRREMKIALRRRRRRRLRVSETQQSASFLDFLFVCSVRPFKFVKGQGASIDSLPHPPTPPVEFAAASALKAGDAGVFPVSRRTKWRPAGVANGTAGAPPTPPTPPTPFFLFSFFFSFFFLSFVYRRRVPNLAPPTPCGVGVATPSPANAGSSVDFFFFYIFPFFFLLGFALAVQVTGQRKLKFKKNRYITERTITVKKKDQ